MAADPTDVGQGTGLGRGDRGRVRARPDRRPGRRADPASQGPARPRPDRRPRTRARPDRQEAAAARAEPKAPRAHPASSVRVLAFRSLLSARVLAFRLLLLVAFAAAALADLLSLAVGSDLGHTLAKPLLMPLLAAYVAVRGAPRLLVAALLCGWGGDVLLLLDADPAFLAGMACFAAGHVCYVVVFRSHLFRRYGPPRARARLLAPAYAAALVATVAVLWPDLPADLRVPVAGYSTLLTAMAYTAATRIGPVAGLGGVLFLLSDTLIATGVADWPQLPRPDLWIMLTYLAAQFLLVTGPLRALEARPAPGPTYGEMRSTTP